MARPLYSRHVAKRSRKRSRHVAKRSKYEPLLESMSSMGKNTVKPLFAIKLRQERAGDARSGQFRSKSLPIINLRGKRRLARISRNPRKTQHFVAYYACQADSIPGRRTRSPVWRMEGGEGRVASGELRVNTDNDQ